MRDYLWTRVERDIVGSRSKRHIGWTPTTSQSSGPVHFVSPLCFAFLRPTLARRRPRSSSPQDSRTLSVHSPSRHSPRPHAYRHSTSATARATPALHMSRPVRYPRGPEPSTQARAHGLSRTLAVRCYGRAWPADSSRSGRPQGGGASGLHHLRPIAPRPVA